MQRFKRFIKRFGIDAAGYAFILLGLLTGWLPGPGGIPLILGGLALLSINNHWARRLLIFAKENGSKFLQYIFPENPWIKALHDIFTVTLVVAAVILITQKLSITTIGFTIALVALAIVDFLYNRKRWQRFKNRNNKA